MTPAECIPARDGTVSFGSILQEDRSVLDLLTADYTFVNERLAKHYGIPNVYGPEVPPRDADSGARRASCLLGKARC